MNKAMIDFEHLEKYRENNRIEAKKALGGLPHSIWETYSSFANTIGGIILLGVVEQPDKTFRTVNLPEPFRLVDRFLTMLNDREKVSVNILSPEDIAVREIDGNRIISISVPRADRRDRPVYIGTDPFTGSYRRDGEGDYHCTREEVLMMLRDREGRTQDKRLLTGLGMEAFDGETVRRYRSYLKDCHPGYDGKEAGDGEVLLSVGACATGEDGGRHPTAAGLLMFGFEDEIVKVFPSFYLDYQERAEDGSIENRVVSSSGRWSGNLFDFYLRICGRIMRGLPADIHRPVREAVVNCMVNGDYLGDSGLVIVKRRDVISITNPGSFHIAVEEAINGGRSDPRNEGLSEMFYLVRAGTRAGKGVPDIYRVWREKGWQPPRIQERFRPERITLTLPLKEGEGRTGPDDTKRQEDKDRLIEYVTRHIRISEEDAAGILSVSGAAGGRLLSEMEREGILAVDGNGRVWSLKI